MEIKQYIKENESRFLEELFSLIRIPSISALPQHKDDMLACAERWRQLLLEAGADEAMIMPSQGNPLVYAEKRVSPDAPTVLIYAHYDVMPAEPLELWKSQPFEPEVRDGHIWARGADDDKGQAMIQAKAFEYVVKEGLLKHNVKFIFEGEEEIGSPSLNAFLKEHKELLKADVILVSDTSMLGADLPSLTTGLRGLAYWEIEVTGPNRDLHSGHFGGAVANPINTLCSMLAQVIDADGRITIPHFYDDVEEVPAAERDRGLKAQYLFIFAGGLLAVFVVFVILYMAGVDQWVCIAFGVAAASVLVWLTFRLNTRYGEHGLMKLLAARRHPRYLLNRKSLRRLLKRKGGRV